MKNQRAIAMVVAFGVALAGAYVQASMKGNQTQASVNREEIREKIRAKISPDQSSSSQVLTSNDGKTQIQLPQGWINHLSAKDKGRFQIKVKNPTHSLHLSVASQAFQKGLKGMTLEKIAKIPVMGMKASLKNPQLEQTNVTKINGYQAMQYKLQGTAHNGAELTFLSTVVETPTSYHVVFAGSPTQTFNQHQAELQQVIQSFKEIKMSANR